MIATVATIPRHVTEFREWAEKEGLPELPELSYNHLMTYVQTCQQRGVVQKTIAHYIADLRKLFVFLISEGSGVDNPAAFVKLRGIKKRIFHNILSSAEL